MRFMVHTHHGRELPYAQSYLPTMGGEATLCAEDPNHHGREASLCAEASFSLRREASLCAEASPLPKERGFPMRRGLPLT